MSTFKITFTGKKGSGKTQLISRIKGNPFSEKSAPTQNIEISGYNFNEHEFVFRDLPGGTSELEALIEKNTPVYSEVDHLWVYCVDLTKQINLKELKKEIAFFQKFFPLAPVILAGTKSTPQDKEKNNILLDKLKDELNQNLESKITEHVISSSQHDKDFLHLLNLFTNPVLTQLSLFQHAEKKLRTAIKNSSQYKKDQIENALTRMKNEIKNSNNTMDDKMAAIQFFSKQCQQVIDNNNRSSITIVRAILAVTAATSVALITGLIGFGIGFAAGAWSGPGAFFTATASSVITTSSFFGLVTGGLTAYGLFKPSWEVTSLKAFTKEVTQGFHEISQRQ